MEFIQYILNKLYHISNYENWNNWELVGLFVPVLLALLIEYFFVDKKEDSSLYRLMNFSNSVRNDVISWSLLGIGLSRIIGLFATLGMVQVVNYVLIHYCKIEFLRLIDNPYLNFVLIYLLSDLKEYIRHYIAHRFEPIWRFHEFHHSADEFVLITTDRSHVAEISLHAFYDTVLYVLVGATYMDILALGYLQQLHLLLQHSNINSDWGFVGKYFLISPNMHRIHHSIDPKHYNKNFGVLFVFWDRLFGTYYAPKGENITLGIPAEKENYNERGYFFDMYLGYKKFIHSLKSLFSKV